MQNLHRDIWSTLDHLPNPVCPYQVGYWGKKSYYEQYSHNTSIRPIKHDGIFMY